MKKSVYKCALVCGSALAFAIPQFASAQDRPEAAPQDEGAASKDSSEIIVTGTQIRGIKPVGASVVAQGREDIESSGKNDLNQVLSQLPQSQNFLGIAQPGGNAAGAPPNVGTIANAASGIPVNRPNLRSIPGTALGTGSPTLVMLDGHRIVPVGNGQAVVDLGLIPTSILDRNEIMLDGASAIYGSDSVAGVINLITRKRYDGVKVAAHYGFADDYWQRDFSVVAGKNWGTGGFLISYEYAANNEVKNSDRDYFLGSRNFLVTGAPFTGTQCPVPNITIAGGVTAHVEGSGLAAGALNCAQNQWSSFIAGQKRHSVFLSGEQELSDTVKLDITGLYSNRSTIQNDGPVVVSGITKAVGSTFYRPLASNPTATQSLSFNLGPLLGYDTLVARTRIELFNVTPELTVDVGSWQVRGLFNFGQSTTSSNQNRIDSTVLNPLFTSTINPYDVASSGAAGLQAAQGAFRQYIQQNKQQFMQARLVADGPIFTLPAGEVRVAVGAEWMQHKAERVETTSAFTLPPSVSATTSSKSVFGEIVLPLVSSQNAMPLISELTLSASGRFDDYGRYGSTFNPRLAATYNPVDWITLRGSWAKTFRAPNAIDRLPGTVLCVAASAVKNCSASFAPAGSTTASPTGYNFTDTNQQIVGIVLGGTNPNVRPEKATNWSIGFDIDPPILPGLRLSASYWEIHYRDQISRFGATVSSIYQTAVTIPGNLSKICVNPPATPGGVSTAADYNPALCSATDIAAFIAAGTGGSSILSTLALPPAYQVALLLDQRQANLGHADIAGMDASVAYRRQTGFGSIDARAAVSIPVKSSTQATATALVLDSLATGTADYRMTAQIGANIGRFRAQASWQFSSNFVAAEFGCQIDVNSTCTANRRDPNQFHTGQFDTVDLYFRYTFDSPKWTKDLELSLNVNNVFNSTPPVQLTTTGGVAGGQTVGRMVQLGIAKKF